MASKRKINPASVVWHAPETVHTTLPDVAERFAEELEGASVQDIVRAASQASGEYREYLGEREDDAGAIRPSYGSERLVWVDGNPGDVEDPKGHYEVYDGPAAEYRPVRREG